MPERRLAEIKNHLTSMIELMSGYLIPVAGCLRALKPQNSAVADSRVQLELSGALSPEDGFSFFSSIVPRGLFCLLCRKTNIIKKSKS